MATGTTTLGKIAMTSVMLIFCACGIGMATTEWDTAQRVAMALLGLSLLSLGVCGIIAVWTVTFKL